MKIIILTMLTLILGSCVVEVRDVPSTSEIRRLVIQDMQMKLPDIELKYRPVLDSPFTCFVGSVDYVNDKYVIDVKYEINGIPGSKYVVLAYTGSGYAGDFCVGQKTKSGQVVTIEMTIFADYPKVYMHPK